MMQCYSHSKACKKINSRTHYFLTAHCTGVRACARVCIYIYIYMCVCVCVCVCVCELRTCVYLYDVCMYICMYIYMYVFIYMYVYMYYVRMYVCMYVCIARQQAGLHYTVPCRRNSLSLIQNIQTDSGSYPASYLVSNGGNFPWN